MSVFLILLAVLALLGIGATVLAVLKDGYGPVPDRSPALPHRRRRPAPVRRPVGARDALRAAVRQER